jgi:hypothetical protein
VKFRSEREKSAICFYPDCLRRTASKWEKHSAGILSVNRYGLGTGGVAVISGRGAGQVRRLVAMASDNRTLQVDRAFVVTPDETSEVKVFMTWIYSAIIRDNVFIGAKRQVEQEDHTAACMIPLWGRAGTVDFINNVGHDMRGTMYIQVNPNLTVTDHIIRNTVSTYTCVCVPPRNDERQGCVFCCFPDSSLF